MALHATAIFRLHARKPETTSHQRHWWKLHRRSVRSILARIRREGGAVRPPYGVDPQWVQTLRELNAEVAAAGWDRAMLVATNEIPAVEEDVRETGFTARRGDLPLPVEEFDWTLAELRAAPYLPADYATTVALEAGARRAGGVA